MKTVLYATLLFAFAFGLTGCDPIKGTLNVRAAFEALVEKDMTGCSGEYDPNCNEPTETVTIEPGDYAVSFDLQTKRRALVSIKTKRTRLDLPLNVPKGKQIPLNGSVTLTSRDSGQPFDVAVDVRTTLLRSPTYKQRRTCTYSWVETVCSPYTPHPPYGQGCWNRVFTRQGLQDVEYYYETTGKNLAVNFHAAGDSKVTLAQFRGAQTKEETIYTYVSSCRP